MYWIKGKCRTNLDDYVCPITKFAKVPDKGDKVHVLYKGYSSTLKVVGVTHDERGEEPYIIVELHR